MDCTEAVYSNEYYDFIFEHNDRGRIPESVTCYQNINEQYSILYEDRAGQPELNLTNFTYSSIPKCFSILDLAAMEASNILRIQNQPTLSLKGQGVLIGFIDTGIDYRNPLFRNNDGTSRIAAIWDQTIQDGIRPEGFIYGTEYRTEQINDALAQENPLELVPSEDENGHGTYIASLAAGGSNLENQFIGAAPYAGIAVVKLKEAKQYLREFFFVKKDAVVFQENDIMAGLEYLHRLANQLSMPLVICICLGSNSGRHTGSNVLSRMLDGISSRRRRAAVIAGGNEANKRHHHYGVIMTARGSENVEISVADNVSGFVTELWSLVPDLFSVEIVSPTGERLIRRSGTEGSSIEHTFLFENTRITIDYRVSVADNGAQLIFMRFIRPAKGIWNVRVYFDSGFHGIFHMWLPMKEMLDGEVFYIRSNPDVTITVPGNATLPITVGGYDARNDSIFLDSGRGFTMTGIIKPDDGAILGLKVKMKYNIWRRGKGMVVIMDKEELMKFGIDYDQGIKRFMGNEELFKKFLIKFKNDNSYSRLMKALKEDNCQEAYNEAHTLKGVAANLSMINLLEIVSEMSKILHDGELEKGKQLQNALTAQYLNTMELVDRL